VIPAPIIEEVRSRIDPVEVIGRRVELRKSGASFSGSCPFHADRTPSFRVYPDSKRFKCFGCGARGDVFEFVRRFDGKDFRTVVQELAAEAGIAFQAQEGSAQARAPDPGRARAERACAAALEHWTQRLWSDSGNDARRFLATRGIEEATAREYRLGAALREWHDLERALRARGFTEDELLAAGLLARSGRAAEESCHDRFRGRVMFPFIEASGRVIGFAGRAVAHASESREPKYLNGPETPVFRKGHLLFGHPRVAQAICSARRAILVEGYFDAIALHQAGIREVVACGGTAITEHHVGLLQRWRCEELVVLFDTDPAGLAAPAQLAPVVLRAGITTKIATLPGRRPSDPDEFVRAKGAGELSSALLAATPLTEWLLERAISARTPVGRGRGLSVEEKLLVVRDLRQVVNSSREGLPRALFEQRIARRLELYIVALRAELARGGDGRVHERQRGGAPWPA